MTGSSVFHTHPGPSLTLSSDHEVQLVSIDNDTSKDTIEHREQEDHQLHSGYRLYKARFTGMFAIVVLNLAAGLCWSYFGPIANNMVSDFGVTLDQVNWLGNIESCIAVPGALFVPLITKRYGLRRCCDFGALALLISSWVRYAGTLHSLSTNQAYGLLILGQFFSSIAQPVFLVLGPVHSETWFDLQGRTTATMVMSIANPIGGALGQLISPLVGTTRQAILVLGIICTVAAPAVFLIRSAPPTPPTYAGSVETPSLGSLLLVLMGKETNSDVHPMTLRERIDFGIVLMLFGVLVGASNAFGILSAEIFEPQGYSSDESGLLGACLLLTGIVAAVITAPLSDRVFTHHLALTAKCLVPIVAAAWFSLIWAVKPNNTPGLFVIMTLIGVSSVALLPIGLELGCEITRNANGSAALLWSAGNLFCIVDILVQGALRAPDSADPPLNMKKSLIYNAALVMVIAVFVFFLRGEQKRKDLDRRKDKESKARRTGLVSDAVKD